MLSFKTQQTLPPTTIPFTLSQFTLFSFDSYGFESSEPAATAVVSVPGATGQASPRGHLQSPSTASVPRHLLPPRCMHQALCHQESKRSVRRLGFTWVQRLQFCLHQCGLLDQINICFRVSTLPSLLFFFPLFSSSKPRQRASRLRWILIQRWWKTSSVWMKWRRTWELFSMHSKTTLHATSASEPRQVFSLSPSHVSVFVSLYALLYETEQLLSRQKNTWKQVKNVTLQRAKEHTKTQLLITYMMHICSVCMHFRHQMSLYSPRHLILIQTTPIDY